MTDRPPFAAAFERLRLSRGWSPAEVARRLDVYPTEVSRWRRGGGISVNNVRKVANLFGVDAGELERLAGYPASSVGDTGDTINPEIAAMLDAERAQLLEGLLDIPPVFWETILIAQREARRIAMDMARRAIALTAGPMISTPSAGELAPPSRKARENKRQGDQPEGGKLQLRFAPAGAH